MFQHLQRYPQSVDGGRNQGQDRAETLFDAFQSPKKMLYAYVDPVEAKLENFHFHQALGGRLGCRGYNVMERSLSFNIHFYKVKVAAP